MEKRFYGNIKNFFFRFFLFLHAMIWAFLGANRTENRKILELTWSAFSFYCFFTCSFSFWFLYEVNNSFLLHFVDCMVQRISHRIQ